MSIGFYVDPVDAAEFEAILVIPGIGLYKYIGRTLDAASSRRVVAALNRAKLDPSEREYPYEYGVRLFGDDPNGLREATFGCIDRNTFEGEIYPYGDGSHSHDNTVNRKMTDQTNRKIASICDVFGCYYGVYVSEWTMKRPDNGVPNAERPYLEN